MKMPRVLQRILPFLIVAPAAFGAESTDWLSEIRRNIAASEYEISHPENWQAPNRAHGFRTFFDERGIRVVSREEPEPTWEWRLSWVAYGRGGASWPVDAAVLDAKGAHIDYHRGSLREWYDNSPRGLKQGFFLAAPPEEVGRRTGMKAERAGTVSPGRARKVDPDRLVHVDLALGGSLRPLFSEDGLAIDFEAPGGGRVIRYAGLRVIDARGQTLAAWMEGYAGTGGGGIRIVIDDTGAIYPITIDPLATFPAWTAGGGQDWACFGESVATAGDVNGDGFSDVVVGAPCYDAGQYDEGRAFVYYGTASGPSATASWTAESDQDGAFFGYSVSTAGDVNADGFSDVLVGASLRDNGLYDRGRVYLFLGSAAGLNAAPAWTQDGEEQGAELGTSVAAAGDVNGGGFGDVIVGAPKVDGGGWDLGRAYLYLGSALGPDTNPAWIATGTTDLAFFGKSVATAGDVNGDGFADVIVGAPSEDTGMYGPGSIFAYHGSASGLSPVANWSQTDSQDAAQFGFSVGTAGDVNGDGYADVIVGAPQETTGGVTGGSVYVYHGSASGLSSSGRWSRHFPQQGAMAGVSVATAGDVNGDGYADIIFGAERYYNPEPNEGAAFVHLGSASGVNANVYWSTEGNGESALLGRSVGTAGDVNGDGVSDVVVGAPYLSLTFLSEGQASVYLGSPAGLAESAGWTAEGDSNASGYGSSVGTAGDVNGDGYADVIVGVPYYDGGVMEGGRVLVYLGSAFGLATSPSWIADGDQTEGWFGFAVGTGGDVNGDGFSDVVVGAPRHDAGKYDEGRAFVYLGSASGLATTPAWSAKGDQEVAVFGWAVGSAGDVNGDGYADVIVGAPYFDDGPLEDAGRAFVYHGSAAGLAPLAGWTSAAWWGYGAQFGCSVGTAGDVNGDGYADIVVGSELDMAFVYQGSASGLAAVAEWSGYGEVNEYFGHAVGTAGDVNGDGYADVIIGAPRYPYPLQQGRAVVFLGSASGLAQNAAWSFEDDQAGAHLGEAVGTAGDLNGDGYADIVVGAPDRDAQYVDHGRVLVFHGSASGLPASPVWSVDGASARNLGESVGTAGDVNGDGYAELIVGAPALTGADRGHAYLHYGNGGPGLALLPRQLRDDLATPIAPLGESDRTDGFRLSLIGRSPFGRGKIGVDWEVKTLGVLFDGEGLESVPPEHDTGTDGRTLEGVLSGLAAGRPFHWRARLVHDPVTYPFQRRGRWIAMPWNGWQEADLRTDSQADLSVSQTDSPDPQFEGQPVDYTVAVSNEGPAAATATLTDTFPEGSTFVSASPAQGTCSHTSGIVTCDLGEIGVGATAEVVIQVSAPDGWGTATNVATVAVGAPATDPEASNDTSSESTQIRALNIGDRVWRDLDRDGVQDEGEPGLAGVVVLLYDGAGGLLDAVATNHNGYYTFFEGLSYGTLYNLRFDLPVGFDFSPRDQGADDSLDSDADPVTGDTAIFSLTEFTDATGWDAGMHDCWAPDEAVWLYEVGVTNDGNDYPVLNFQDPNQPDQVTGYNIYRSDDAGLPPAEWPLVASDVVDMDEATPNKQWVDTSGDVPPSGIWYYQVTAANHRCPAEGPR